MAMPFPRFFMIPFGCVICSRKIWMGTSVDVYIDNQAIKRLHPAFARKCDNNNVLADEICNTVEDYDPSVQNDGDKSIIAYASLPLAVVHPPHLPRVFQTWCLDPTSSDNTVPHKVKEASAAEFPRIITAPDLLYFLLLTGVNPTIDAGDDDKKHRPEPRSRK
jgi:hypothetical protein